MDSVFAQTYRPVELIVIDDGSTDGTGELVAGWSTEHNKDDLFTVCYYPQRNLGAPAARNRGLQHAHGEYIQFLDSDDILLPDKCKAQIEQLEANPSAEWSVCGVRHSSSSSFSDYYPQAAEDRCALLSFFLDRGGFWFLPLSPIYKANATAKIGPWNESLLCSQDFEYTARAITRLSAPVRTPVIGGIWNCEPRSDRILMSFDTKRFIRSRYDATRLVYEHLNDQMRTPDVLEKLAKRAYTCGRYYWKYDNIEAQRMIKWAVTTCCRSTSKAKYVLMTYLLAILGTHALSKLRAVVKRFQ